MRPTARDARPSMRRAKIQNAGGAVGGFSSLPAATENGPPARGAGRRFLTKRDRASRLIQPSRSSVLTRVSQKPCPREHSRVNVCRGFVHSFTTAKTVAVAKTSLSGRLDKQTAIHPDSAMLFSARKEGAVKT